MNSERDSEAPPPTSGDLRHDDHFDGYRAAEDVNAFYGENGGNYAGEGGEGEHEDDSVDRPVAERESSRESALRSALDVRGSLLDFVYAAREQQQEEEEQEEREDEAPEGDSFSPVKYEQTRFGCAALSDEERREIVQKLKDLFGEANVLMVANKFLHKNYVDLNRKSPSMANALDKFDEALVFEDPRYQTTLESFAQARDAVHERRASLEAELEQLQRSRDSAERTYAETFERLLSGQQAVAKRAKPAKRDKESWLAELGRQLDNQRQRAAEVAKIRLAHVQLLSKLARLTARLKRFDSLGPGFSMMDYEYLLKRKDIYSERRDEQRDNIGRLRGRNLACAAMSRHVAEETDLYNEKVIENLSSLGRLASGNKRERARAVELAKTKVAISKGMARLKEEIGLLNYPFLLRKMERDLREIGKLRRRSDGLQAKMIVDAKKIAQTRA